MRCVHVLAVAAIAMLSVSSASAQFGLYGSPELLRLPPIQQASAEQVGQVATPLPPGPSGAVAYDRVPRSRARTATFIPADPGYTENVVRPVIETPVAPVPEIPSLNDTFVSAAPGDSPKKAPNGKPRGKKPTPKPVPAPSAGDEVVSRMLQDAGCCEPNPWTEGSLAGCGPEECAPCAPYVCTPWFVGVSGLVMGRDSPNRVWTTYDAADQSNQLMHTDIGLSWEAGAEITFGRHFCCDTWSIGATYWSLNQFSEFASQTAVGGVSTPLDFTDVIYANGALAGLLPVTLFDGAQEHRLWRTNEVHNIELNLVRNHVDMYLGDPGMRNPVAVDWMVGARFFRFEEDLRFGSLEGGAFTWAADPDHQGYLEDRISNNLVGFQFGANVDYEMCHGLSLFLRPKIGIYNNHIRNTFMAYRGDGELFLPDPAPTPPPVRSAVPGSYPVNSTVDAFSFMTEVDLGIAWEFMPRWTFTAGYRVLVATGMGLADNQFAPYVVDIPEIANVEHNGQLLLHGVFSGIEFNY